MILIDAIYINNSGGKVLLDYLIETLEKTEIQFHYLLDDRIVNNHPSIKQTNPITYLKASLISRHKFYNINFNSFTRVLCFGNLPPTIKLKVEVLTYFINLFLLKIPKSLKFISKVKIIIKMYILSFIKKNTDIWLVQSENVKTGIVDRYKLDIKSVLLIPFYPPLPKVDKVKRIKRKFIYISNVGVHKNHQRLIEGFCKFYDEFQVGELGLTISDDASHEIASIQSLQKKGYPITNYGFIKRENVAVIYASSEYLIFPSLAESFGLALVEAIESGCKIIGANLPYTYEICQPSIVFDALTVNDISFAFEQALIESANPTIKKISNEIENLIKLLSK